MPERFALTYVANENGDKAKAKKELQKRLKEDRGTIYENDIEAAIDLVDKGDFTVERKSLGALYQLEIPENDVLLDEQKTFAEQPKKVREALEKVFKHLEMGQAAIALIKTGNGFEDNDNGRHIYKEITHLCGGSPRAASELLNKYGIEGITYDGRQDGRCFVIFNDEAVKIINRYNQMMNGEDAKGSYNIADRLMRLFQSADASTPIHESAHWYMGEQEEIVNILRDAQPNHRIVKDFDKLNRWAEWKPGMINAYRNTPVLGEFKALHDEIAALENKANRTQAEEAELRRLKRQWRFERIARGFEVYMQSGKAPTSGLRHIFEQFRNWLFKIYNDLTQSGMKASPEVEKIFDRWIANSKEIQAQMGKALDQEAKTAYKAAFRALQDAGYEKKEAHATAVIMARMAARLSEAYKEAGQEKSALDLLPRIVRDNEGLANNRDESLAGNPEAAAKFFSKRAEESNALARVHDGMQLEDIRERLLHEENTMVYNAVDDYETLLADKRASQAMKDNAYGNLLKLVEEIDEKRRAFNNGEVIESLAGILRGKIRIGEGSNLEKDLSGDYLRKAGDLQKKTPGAQLIPGEYKRIEEKTKARKDLFARMRQEIR
ncbi:MAG: hypothetical protein IJ521_12450, partial [Schwartzia sp.]|nr:hypothetical protein [Schwartzia sp. (in: firmicutes)]